MFRLFKDSLLFTFLRQVFCKHKKKVCVSNIHRDLINDIYCYSVWKCERCGKIFLKDELEPTCNVVNFKLTHQHEDKGERKCLKK